MTYQKSIQGFTSFWSKEDFFNLKKKRPTGELRFKNSNHLRDNRIDPFVVLFFNEQEIYVKASELKAISESIQKFNEV
jgi:hypothetical protein